MGFIIIWNSTCKDTTNENAKAISSSTIPAHQNDEPLSYLGYRQQAQAKVFHSVTAETANELSFVLTSRAESRAASMAREEHSYSILWQYGLWSFLAKGTKFERLRIRLMRRCQKVPKFDFQSQFSMSKIT